VWLLFGNSSYALLLAQLACYILALYWLLVAVRRLTSSGKALFGVGMLLALSPLQIGWFRFILTEPLALATATWFIAELINSVSQKKLRAFHLASALSAAIYIRPDAILMAFGAILVSFYIYGNRSSFRNIAIFIALTSLPVSGWMLRNILVGHSPLSMTSEASPKASGYFMWLDTWVTNEYERSDASFPVWRGSYSDVKLHSSKFVIESELDKANELVQQLSAFDGRQFPEYIDNQFKELSLQKISSRSYLTYFEIYSKRAAFLLFNPFSSWGLPLELNGIDRSIAKNVIGRFEMSEMIEFFGDQIFVILGKLIGFAYRVVIFLVFFFLTTVAIFSSLKRLQWNLHFEMRVFILATSAVVFLRVLFFVFILGLESRYLVELMPWVECCVGLSLLGLHRKKNID
jgi:hypothetical protein